MSPSIGSCRGAPKIDGFQPGCSSGPGDNLHQAISETANAVLSRTIGATEHASGDFNAVTNNATAAMLAGRSQRVNRTLKTVEDMADMIPPNLERLVVVVSTNFTPWHDRSLV
jgi:hypothetical protein